VKILDLISRVHQLLSVVIMLQKYLKHSKFCSWFWSIIFCIRDGCFVNLITLLYPFYSIFQFQLGYNQPSSTMYICVCVCVVRARLCNCLSTCVRALACMRVGVYVCGIYACVFCIAKFTPLTYDCVSLVSSITPIYPAM